MTDKLKERISYYKKMAQSKNYKQQTVEMGFMLSYTKEAVAKFGSSDNALEEVIKLCEKHDNPKDFINAVCLLIGID